MKRSKNYLPLAICLIIGIVIGYLASHSMSKQTVAENSQLKSQIAQLNQAAEQASKIEHGEVMRYFFGDIVEINDNSLVIEAETKDKLCVAKKITVLIGAETPISKLEFLSDSESTQAQPEGAGRFTPTKEIPAQMSDLEIGTKIMVDSGLEVSTNEPVEAKKIVISLDQTE